MSKEEGDYLPQSKVKSYSADYVFEHPKWAETVCKHLRGDVYITIDLDVFDPSIMSATGTPEPGGLYWRDVLTLLKTAAGRSTIADSTWWNWRLCPALWRRISWRQS